jgi:hypothetical protein
MAALGLGCGSAAPPAPACAPPGAREALPALVDALRGGAVVVLGEHHAVPAEAELGAALITGAAEAGIALTVAHELIPAAAAPELEALLAAPAWSPEAWARVVGKRPHPRPLALAAAEAPVRAAWARRAAGVGPAPAVVGLAPDCRLRGDPPSSADEDAVVACFEGREGAMAAAVEALPRPLLVLAGHRHAAARAPAADLPAPLGGRVSGPVARVLLAGPEDAGGLGTCGGGLEGLRLRLGPGAWALPLEGPLAGLRGSCVQGLEPTVRLRDLYDLVVVVPPGPPDTPWTAADFERVPPGDRAAWAALERGLMDGAAPGDAAGWAADARGWVGLGPVEPAAEPCARLRAHGAEVEGG